ASPATGSVGTGGGTGPTSPGIGVVTTAAVSGAPTSESDRLATTKPASAATLVRVIALLPSWEPAVVASRRARPGARRGRRASPRRVRGAPRSPWVRGRAALRSTPCRGPGDASAAPPRKPPGGERARRRPRGEARAPLAWRPE